MHNQNSPEISSNEIRNVANTKETIGFIYVMNVCDCENVFALYTPKLSGLSMEKHMRMTSVSG